MTRYNRIMQDALETIAAGPTLSDDDIVFGDDDSIVSDENSRRELRFVDDEENEDEAPMTPPRRRYVAPSSRYTMSSHDHVFSGQLRRTTAGVSERDVLNFVSDLVDEMELSPPVNLDLKGAGFDGSVFSFAVCPEDRVTLRPYVNGEGPWSSGLEPMQEFHSRCERVNAKLFVWCGVITDEVMRKFPSFKFTVTPVWSTSRITSRSTTGATPSISTTLMEVKWIGASRST